MHIFYEIIFILFFGAIFYIILNWHETKNNNETCQHKWKEIYYWHNYKYLGEAIKEKYSYPCYRICEICDKIEKYRPLAHNGWREFDNEIKANILKRKIKDYGDYYMIEYEND